MTKTMRKVLSSRMLLMLFMGFSSGLPLLLTGGTLRAWLKDSQVDLAVVGSFAIVGFPYVFKFLWAPFFDRFTLPFLGRRRGWLLVTQVAVGLSLFYLAAIDPRSVAATFNAAVKSTSDAAQMGWGDRLHEWLLSLGATLSSPLGFRAFLVAFLSSCQDIVIDAYRREILEDDELGLGSSITINGYRIAMLVAGGLAIAAAGRWNDWQLVYQVMGGLMLIGVVTTLLAPEPKVMRQPRTLRESVVEPFLEYFTRPDALTILAFILLYKIGDSMVSDMLNPFYLDMGFSKEQIGFVVKMIALWATILGGLVGGIGILRMGLRRALWIFGLLQSFTILSFMAVVAVGPHLWVLAAAIALETFTGGLGMAAYAGFIASLTNKKFTATQYALLSSFMGVPRVILGSTTGVLAKAFGWNGFFIFCCVIGLPGLLLLLRYPRWLAPRAE